MNTQRTLGIYCRQSREKETKGSLIDQLKKGKEKASELGIKYKVYEDANESAIYDTFDNRPQFRKLLDDISSGSITEVFVIDESRLSRNDITKFEIKKTFKEFNIIIHSSIDGIVDLNNTNDEFISDIKTAIFKKQVRDMSYKIRNVLMNNAEAGQVGGGAVLPYGWMKGNDKMMVHNPEEKAVYLRIVDMSLKGIGTKRIANQLNEEGILSKGAKNYTKGLKIKNKYTGKIQHIEQNKIKWAPNTILGILKNPIYKGERHYKDKIFQVEPIITEAKWTQIQSSLSRNRILSPRNLKEFSLLKGLLRCEKCGRNLCRYVKKAKGKIQNSYICSSKRNISCGATNINIFKLDKLIWQIVSDSDFFINKVAHTMLSMDSNKEIPALKNKLNLLEKQKASIEKQKEKSIVMCTKELITNDEYAKLKKGYDNEITVLNTQSQSMIGKIQAFDNIKANSERLFNFGANVCSAIKNFNEDQKRTILLELIKDIRIDFIKAERKHRVSIELNIGSIINNTPEYFIYTRGVTNYLETSETKVNKRRVMTEKTIKPLEALLENHPIEQAQYPK